MRNLNNSAKFLPFLFLILFLSSSASAKSENKSKHVSSKEFLASPFAKAFKAHQYQKALQALEKMRKKYPNDPLVLRYQALTLERLGRTQEATAAYQKLLSRHPDEPSARIFLGRTYAKRKNYKAAAEEFRRVIRSGAAKKYRGWAQSELNRLQPGVKKRVPKKKPFYFVGKLGTAYDSNPLLLPDDRDLRARGARKNGVEYLMQWNAGTSALSRHDTRIDLLYLGQQTLHNGRASDVNFHSEGFALDAKKRRFFGRRAVLFGGRYDFRANFLRDKLFSVSNRFFLSADTSLVRRTRTHLYTRYNILNFGPDGSNPSRTSRDGFRFGVGVTQYFYTADLRRYFFVKEEFNLNETRGENFNRRGVLSRVGIHTPLDFLKKMDWDVSGGFDYGAYPDFSSLSSLDLEKREDARWDIYTGLTYHWRPRLATRLFYRFIKSNNQNNFFDHNRHMAGGEVIFSI